MGIEPFDEGFTVEALRKAASRRARTSIKAYLLDQASVAGVGNIYADEALFKAGIRPDRVVGDLETDEWQRLRDALVAILTEATEGGGTISDNFFNTEGQPGAYVPRVYGRGGMPCVDCGTLLTRVKITGRGTVYCPKCQTTGRGQ
jgi:formamidopyrimidine-DNA glycosylase